MSNKNNKKTNFFKEAFKSIKDLDKYEDFALETPGKAFKYFIKLIAVLCIIVSIFYTYKIVDNMNKVYSDLKDKMPDFSYSQGNLAMVSEEPVIIEDYKDTFGKIIIDTSITGNEIEKYDAEKSGILILKDKCIILANETMGQVSYKYDDMAKKYNITDFTKQDVVNYVEGMNIVSIYLSVYFVIFIYLYIIYFIAIFIDVLLLSVLAFVISMISRIKLKYAPAFSIAIHSITLPVLLNLIYIVVNLLTGFRVKYFQLMYNTISYIYVIVAILMIKTDFINRQVELMKLAEEQGKVKEEIRKKEEKQKQQEENKKPEEDNKEKPEAKGKSKKQSDDEKGVGADAPACQETGK